MEDSYDKNKIIECMFDPTTSEILAELENEGKESTHLAQILKISEEEVRERLSYLLEHKFVLEKKENEKIIYSADANKLAEVMEKEGNFDSAVDGLATMKFPLQPFLSIQQLEGKIQRCLWITYFYLAYALKLRQLLFPHFQNFQLPIDIFP